MNNLRCFWPVMALFLMVSGCTNNNLIDTNDAIAENSWTYAKSAKATIEIKDATKAYNVYFKLRHTADYRYSNLFVLVHLKGNGLNRNIRYQFKLAQADGTWLGKGSGDIYARTFTLLNEFRFPNPGKYEIEVEQNMRDNPLVGISDIGITVRQN